MRYCITLRSRPGEQISGWYDGTEKCWSTDRRRQKLFEKLRDAKPVCRELRSRWARNALVINIEAEQPGVAPAMPEEGRATARRSNTVPPPSWTSFVRR
jgi:hypothetical protein